jgi:S-adenosylmethionine:diacylglycerol 3-amino-3-carboxypropyl transferase
MGGKAYYEVLCVGYRRYIMVEEEVTTIQLKKSVVKKLKAIRRYPRETYNETISNLIKMAKHSRTQMQYDEFIHSIQQAKMKELWDNEEDEAWENA